MKKLFSIFLLAMVISNNTYADYDYQFLRIACIPEAGFLDISHQFVHNTAIDVPVKNVYQIFEESGFYSPHKLDIKCKFAGGEYRIVATQEEPYSGMCGATPDILLSLYRNEKLMIENVIFGYSCFNNPSVNKIYIHASKNEYPPKEMEVCLSNNSSTEKVKKEECKWFFSNYIESYEKMFPLNSNRLNSYFKPK
ncbi:hypothetical protein D0C16_01250 [Cellvibrio sp. KY-GH-1]|uniref:hypothetical protein n=1 Tax=Cellvibrio sp. KY-GH-1 TaxID=2303332 RepID=UPI0012487CD1|nr:hypothetical protein [Cellvibrio sp. KY-GH-1]QEY14719.1 hypothetical protein D0C16_01250 [Cellvibrio sp. KY-GH-1]